MNELNILKNKEVARRPLKIVSNHFYNVNDNIKIISIELEDGHKIKYKFIKGKHSIYVEKVDMGEVQDLVQTDIDNVESNSALVGYILVNLYETL